MKKFLGIAAAIFLCSGFAFAKVNYNGDIQLRTGFGFDTTNAKYTDGTFEHMSTLFTFDVATTHLWGTSEKFKFGFMVAANGSFGGVVRNAYTINGVSHEVSGEDNFIAVRSTSFFGPCFGIMLNDKVQLNIVPGFSTVSCNMASSLDSDTDEVAFYSSTGFGAGIDIQAKFYPNSHFSPVVGYRYSFNYAPQYTLTTGKIFDDTEKEKIAAYYVLSHFNTLYLGVSFNW